MTGKGLGRLGLDLTFTSASNPASLQTLSEIIIHSASSQLAERGAFDYDGRGQLCDPLAGDRNPRRSDNLLHWVLLPPIMVLREQ